MVNTWSNIIRTRLFPDSCCLCLSPGHSGIELCDDCSAELPWSTFACVRCALPLTRNANISLCSRCQNNSPPIDRCKALFGYQSPVDHWIHRLKFHQDLGLAHLLGQLLAKQLQGHGKNIELLPVPLHSRRLRQRGYNQSLEICRPLLARGFRVTGADIQRTRSTSAQSDLPASARTANIKGAFSVKGDLDGKNILIVDDVMTTGATLNELARTLKKAGASQVHAWVIARTDAR